MIDEGGTLQVLDRLKALEERISAGNTNAKGLWGPDGQDVLEQVKREQRSSWMYQLE